MVAAMRIVSRRGACAQKGVASSSFTSENDSTAASCYNEAIFRIALHLLCSPCHAQRFKYSIFVLDCRLGQKRKFVARLSHSIDRRVSPAF